MWAAQLRQQGPDLPLTIGPVPRPATGAGEVLVQVSACGLNHLDRMVRDGSLPRAVQIPRILGSEVAGRVVEVGDGVDPSWMGRRVAVAPYLSCGQCQWCANGDESVCPRGILLGLGRDGGFAEYMSAPMRSLVPVPDPVTDIEAAALSLSAITAYRMVTRQLNLAPGDWVMIQSAGGGVASYALRLLRTMGVRVIATASTKEKRARALAEGASFALDPEDPDFVHAVRQASGGGVAAVVDPLGSSRWQSDIAVLGRKGTLTTCGALTGRTAATDVWVLFAKELRLQGSYGGTRSDLVHVLDLAAQDIVRPVVDRVVEREAIDQGHALMAARAVYGKVVVKVAPNTAKQLGYADSAGVG